MEQNQLERIQAMEQALNEAMPAVAALQNALERYKEILPKIKMLARYYESELWMKDFEDDSAGKLPADLRRGVLSEDALWNLLSDTDQLREAMGAVESARPQ